MTDDFEREDELDDDLEAAMEECGWSESENACVLGGTEECVRCPFRMSFEREAARGAMGEVPIPGY